MGEGADSGVSNAIKFSLDNNMGLVRYVLALAVFVSHFNYLFQCDIPFPLSSFNAVGGFFALSGFLVYPGYLKHFKIRPYLLRRARRILPPYMFIVFLCAFSFVAVSSLSPQEYFGCREWWEYLVSNILFLNFLQPDLPGVFDASPEHAVNPSLWTMKIEVLLYLSVPFVAWVIFRIHRKFGDKGRIWVLAMIYLFSMVYRLVFHFLYENYGSEIFNILSRQVFGQLMYFYTGVIIYFKYQWFVRHRYFIIISVALLAWAGQFIPYYQLMIGPLVVSSATLFFSFIPGITRIFNYNNVSYGVYLFHFPVIQLIYQYFGTSNIPMAFALSVACVFLLAFFCWFVIEKPLLPKRFI